MNFNHNEFLFNGPCSLNVIKNAERALSLSFPESYKIFLAEVGAGGVEGDYIYGLGKNDFDFLGELPEITAYHVVWSNLFERRHFLHPLHLITIYDLGDGTTYCLDTSQMDEYNECPVVVWPIGGYEETPVLEIIAKDFGEFFLKKIEEQIQNIKDECDE